MLSHDALAVEMAVLKQSTCFGNVAMTMSCPNRMEAEGTRRARVCRRCEVASDRVLAFVSEVVWQVVKNSCHRHYREDVAGEVISEFVERLHNGRLLSRWMPGTPVQSIASRAFVRMRVISACRALVEQSRTERVLSVFRVEMAETSNFDGNADATTSVLRELLQPQRWRGQVVEITASLQLFPELRDDIAANSHILSALTAILRVGSAGGDALSLLNAYHQRKAATIECEIDDLADKVLRARTAQSAESFRGQIDETRTRARLTPLDARDLQRLLGLTTPNAEKRMSRYQDYLEAAMSGL